MRRELAAFAALVLCLPAGCGKGCATDVPTSPPPSSAGAPGGGTATSLGEAVAEGGGSAPSVAVLPGGAVAAAFLLEGAVHVKTWDGKAWTAAGSPAKGVASAQLAAGRDGGLLLACVHAGEVAGLTVHRRSGDAWSDLGGDLRAGGGAVLDARIVDSSGGPVVALVQHTDHGKRLLAKLWTGTAWEALGGELNVQAGSNVVALALASGATRVALAWTERVPQQPVSLEVRRLANASWEKLPAPAGADGDTTSVGLAFGREGELLLAMNCNSGLRPVARITEKGVADVGLPKEALAGGGYLQCLLAGDGAAFLAWTSPRFGVARYDGKWEVLSEELSGAGGSGHDLALAAGGDAASVAWRDTVPSARIRGVTFRKP